jgi:hypothetical protein
MNVNWTPFRKLQARGMRLGPLVVDGDTVSVLELGEYFVFSAIDAAELTAWVGTLEEAMVIGEEWLMAKLSAHERLAVHAERARLGGRRIGHPREQPPEVKDTVPIGRSETEHDHLTGLTDE